MPDCYGFPYTPLWMWAEPGFVSYYYQLYDYETRNDEVVVFDRVKRKVHNDVK